MYNTALMVFFFDHQILQVTSFPSKITIAINIYFINVQLCSDSAFCSITARHNTDSGIITAGFEMTSCGGKIIEQSLTQKDATDCCQVLNVPFN